MTRATVIERIKNGFVVRKWKNLNGRVTYIDNVSVLSVVRANSFSSAREFTSQNGFVRQAIAFQQVLSVTDSRISIGNSSTLGAIHIGKHSKTVSESYTNSNSYTPGDVNRSRNYSLLFQIIYRYSFPYFAVSYQLEQTYPPLGVIYSVNSVR